MLLPLFGLIGVSFLFVFLSTLYDILSLCISHVPAMKTLSHVIGIMLPFMQALLAFIFLFLMLYFLSTRNVMRRMRPKEAKVMVMIAIIAGIGFLGYLIMMITNIIPIMNHLFREPRGMFTFVLLRRTSIFLRGVALLLILEVRTIEMEDQMKK